MSLSLSLIIISSLFSHSFVGFRYPFSFSFFCSLFFHYFIEFFSPRFIDDGMIWRFPMVCFIFHTTPLQVWFLHGVGGVGQRKGYCWKKSVLAFWLCRVETFGVGVQGTNNWAWRVENSFVATGGPDLGKSSNSPSSPSRPLLLLSLVIGWRSIYTYKKKENSSRPQKGEVLLQTLRVYLLHW